jgi:hypothetical protein
MSIFNAPSFYSQADQDIYNRGFSFIPQEQFRGGAFNFPTMIGGPPGTGVLKKLPNISGGDRERTFAGTTGDLTTNFMDEITNRQNRLNNPSDKFFGFNTMRDQQLTGADAGFYDTIPQERTFAGNIQDFLTPQSADDIIAEGYEPRMKLGILANIIPDRFGTLPRGDQAFIARNMGYIGPTVFGDNQSGLSKDPFGLNTRSGFGNYAERVGEEYSNLGESLSGRLADKYGAEFDEETGMFVGPNAAKANQMTKMMRAKYNFYGQQTRQRDLDRRAAAERLAAEAEAAMKQKAFLDAKKARNDSDRDNDGVPDYVEDAGGTAPGGIYSTDYFGDSSPSDSGGGGGGAGGGADMGGGSPGSSGPGGSDEMGSFAYGGRVPYMMGGLADLVDIYD